MTSLLSPFHPKRQHARAHQCKAHHGEPYWLDREDETLTTDEQRRRDAEQYNLARFDEICDVLMLFSRRLKLRWTESRDPQNGAGILRIQGLKLTWDPDTLTSRFELTSSVLWELKTGKSRAGQALIPLVKLIRYADDDANDLELVFNAMAGIRKLPGGAVISRRWTGFSEGFKP
jgi:hypothetical protein